MIPRRSLLLLTGALALTYCGPAPKPPAVLTLVMNGSADQNPDINGKASPVAVRVYQLTATAKFERGDVFALTEHEQQTLGSDDAGSQEFVLAPGESRTLNIELKPGVQAIGVVVLYRDIDNAKWRADAPAASSGPTNLTLTIGKLAVTLKPQS
ncbi:MAG TPA: type VI secretion system lipoprotein TssJ [Acetobacteraceae bacterium]|nr:type VI secretion system lipoprotein TssJ [Acetobacteraceae bacterium]